MHKNVIDYQRAFNVLLPPGVELRAWDLQVQFMELVGINSEKRYAYIKVKALQESIITKREEEPTKVFYSRGPRLYEELPL